MKIGDLVQISKNAKFYSCDGLDWIELQQAKYGTLLDVTPHHDDKNQLYFTWSVLYEGMRVSIQEEYLACDYEDEV